MSDPKLIEAVARAMRKAGRDWLQARLDANPGSGLAWGDIPHEVYAEAALSAINASRTHWVAPVEATDAMIDRGMIDAADSGHPTDVWNGMRTAFLAEQEIRENPVNER